MANTAISTLDGSGATIKIAQVSVSESAETRYIGRVHLNDSAGNSISPATEATLGALSAKFSGLVNGAAPVSVISRSNNAFIASTHVIPSTLTSGTYYLTLVNDSASVDAKITRIRLTLNFTGTAAATRSLLDLVHFTSGTPSGGSSVTVLKKDSANASAACDVLAGASGVTLSASGETTLRTISQMSQITTQLVFDFDVRDAPLVLHNGQGIAVKANGSIVSGLAFGIDISFEENAV